MTDDSAFKKQIRTRMAATGENYTTARQMVIAGRDRGQPPVALRVYLNPHVDVELTDQAARAYAAADEPQRRRSGCPDCGDMTVSTGSLARLLCAQTAAGTAFSEHNRDNRMASLWPAGAGGSPAFRTAGTQPEGLATRPRSLRRPRPRRVVQGHPCRQRSHRRAGPPCKARPPICGSRR